MLVYELFQNYKPPLEKHRQSQTDCYFMNIETDLKNLELELKQVKEIKKYLNKNINTFLNNDTLVIAFISGLYHFKKTYNIFKKVDFITDNRKVYEITNNHIKIIKEVINYYNNIIKVLKKNANEQQLKFINNAILHFKE